MSAEFEPITRSEAAADIVLTVLLVLASAIGAGLLVTAISSGPPNLAVAVLLQGLLSLAGVQVLLRLRDQRWSDIGLAVPRARDLPRALLVLLAGFAAIAALGLAVAALSPGTLEEHIAGLESVAGDLRAGTSRASALALLVVVGFYEEVVSRGLLLTRARRLFGGSWAPAVFSAVLFALGHFYQGAYGIVQTALFGLVLAAFTIRWGTLWPAILAHTVFNMLSIVQLEDLPAAA